MGFIKAYCHWKAPLSPLKIVIVVMENRNCRHWKAPLKLKQLHTLSITIHHCRLWIDRHWRHSWIDRHWRQWIDWHWQQWRLVTPLPPLGIDPLSIRTIHWRCFRSSLSQMSTIAKSITPDTFALIRCLLCHQHISVCSTLGSTTVACRVLLRKKWLFLVVIVKRLSGLLECIKHSTFCTLYERLNV